LSSGASTLPSNDGLETAGASGVAGAGVELAGAFAKLNHP
jgi:hypothetical protein